MSQQISEPEGTIPVCYPLWTPEGSHLWYQPSGDLHRIYIAGPMTGLPEFNYPAFHQAAQALRWHGYGFRNPADMFPGDNSLPYETYLREGLRLLLQCTAVVLLPSWETSKGTALELTVATRFKMPVRRLKLHETNLDLPHVSV